MQIRAKFSSAILKFMKSADGVSVIEFALVGSLIEIFFHRISCVQKDELSIGFNSRYENGGAGDGGWWVVVAVP